MTDEELSISDATLIARLRELATNMFQSGSWGKDLDTTKAAADRIEALVKELAVSNELGRAFEEDAGQQRAHAERLEEALIWCSGSADFNEGGVAHKGWLKVCAPLLKGESHD